MTLTDATFSRRGLLLLPGLVFAARAQDASRAAGLVNEARRARKAGNHQESLGLLRKAFTDTAPGDEGLRARILLEKAGTLDAMDQTLAALQETELSLELKEDPAARKFLHELQDKLAVNPELASKGLAAAFESAKEVRIVRRGAPPVSVKSWVNFRTNEYSLTPGGVRQAETLAGHMASRSNDGYRFLIAGHTDSTGTDAINDPLSFKRAATVLEFARDKGGISPDRLRAEGKGSRVPLRPGASEADYRVNRRVELVLERI